MISVDVPKEIREYKEKLVFGLTIRQFVAVLIAAGTCIPLYIYGKSFINEELLSWIIIFIAIPCVAIGFFKKNGMPFEKYIYAVMKHQVLIPQVTKFKTDNFFREKQTIAEKEEWKGVKPKKIKKYKEQATLERAFLMEEAEMQGQEIDMNKLDEELLTVRKPGGGSKNEDPNKKNKKDKKEKTLKKSKAQIVSEEVAEKQEKDPHYIPTKQEGRMLLAYAKELKKKRVNEINQGKKAVAKKNQKMKKRKTAKTFIPKSTQDDLPYVADYEEGLFEAEPSKFSKCYEIRDINYLTAEIDEQVLIFEKWGQFLNYFSEDVNIGIIIDNRKVSIKEQEKNIFYKLAGDIYDVFREEFNRVLKRQIIAGNNDIHQDKYVTVTIEADSPYEALLKFHKIDGEVLSNLKKIGSTGKLLSTDERLSLLHDKMRKGREGDFRVDYEWLKNQGLSSKDYVAPSSFDFKKSDYFVIKNDEKTYCRCMFVNNLPANLTDEFIFRMGECDFPVLINLNVQPVAQDKALRLVKKQLTGMEANKIEAEKKAIRAGYNPETGISHDLKHSLDQGEKLLDDLQNRNQKMFYVSILLMVSGNTLEELEENTNILSDRARSFTCQLQCFDEQQRDAFQVTMPMGVTPNNKLYVERALTTASTAVFIPFTNQELFQKGGFYYGLNQISKNLVICDRTTFKTPSGFILGSSGSGKSFACKREMMSVLLADDKTGLLVIDPENEYVDFAKAFGGTILSLSPSSKCHINPMDMDANYGLDDEDDPEQMSLHEKKDKALRAKAEYLMSIIQCMVMDADGKTTINPQQKMLIDRAIKRTYEKYLDNDFDEKYIPTLLDLQDNLDKEKGTEDGRKIAEAVEYYTKGSMNLFSHKSNLDFSNRFVVFNIRDLGKELKQISLLIVLDFIWNRMIANCQFKIRTYCYVDEIHVLFQNEFSERYLQQLYKRGRKYGLVITGITQDVTDLLNSKIAIGMLSNSDFILMLNQKGDNLALLAERLHISDAQASYVSMADAGSGLLFAEKAIIPFIDQFPEDSYLYTLMSTKFGEKGADDIQEFIRNLQEEQKRREQEKLQESA